MRPGFSTRLVHLAAIALSLTVAACGGGGGGGSTPPVNSQPGGPPPSSTGPSSNPSGNPSSSPSSKPTATPTSKPTATPTPVQTATPPPNTQAITMLPDTNGRFGLIQIFDWDGVKSHTPMSSSQIQAEASHEDAVWGAFSPGTWNAAHPGMIVSRYLLPVEDDNSMSGHDLNWWQQNHPDWILYACDSQGNPTKQLAWSTANFPDVPLDFSNPSVVQYQISMMLNYLKPNGYNAVAADNTDLLNYLKGGNPTFGQSYIQGYYGCGTYDSSGNFHRLFGPGNDPAFIAAMINWVKTVGAALHQAGLKLIVNHPLYNAVTNGNEQQLLSAVDGMIYEVGFTNYGKYQSNAAQLLRNSFPWAQYTQQHGIAFLITDYMCTGYGGTEPWNNNAPCSFDPSQLPAPQVDWALATYAMVNLGGADVYISPEVGQNYSYRPEYATRYGSPCGSYTNPVTDVYERKFSGALAIVNASSAPYSFQLPSGHTYSDIEGRAVTNPLMLQPADAYFLLTQNGCS